MINDLRWCSKPRPPRIATEVLRNRDSTASEVLHHLKADGCHELSSSGLMLELLSRGYEVDELTDVFAHLRDLRIDLDNKSRQKLLLQALSIDFSDLTLSAGCRIPATEMRAISLAQITLMVQHMRRRLREGPAWMVGRPKDDGWCEIALTDPREVTLYDINSQVILLATAERECSMVELLASHEQKPDFFTSHWYDVPYSVSYR